MRKVFHSFAYTNALRHVDARPGNITLERDENKKKGEKQRDNRRRMKEENALSKG